VGEVCTGHLRKDDLSLEREGRCRGSRRKRGQRNKLERLITIPLLIATL
jgi:hypothetical protein